MTNECIDKELGRLITAYEFDQLAEEDRLRFEAHIMNCPHCLDELQKMGPLVHNLREQRTEIRAALAQRGVHFSLKDRLLAETPAGESVKSKTSVFGQLLKLWNILSRPIVWVPAAAATAVVLFLLLPTMQSNNPYLPYLDFTKAPVNFSTLRQPAGPLPEAQNLFDLGMAAYGRDRYGRASSYLQKALKLAPDQKHWWLYLGISCYLDHHPQAAVEPLETALTGENKRLQAMARWYLAQAWLAQREAGKARPLLEEAIRQRDDYAVRADSLLARISEIKP
jgi:hypothetical protein